MEDDKIEKKYGKIVLKFDTFHPGWDMDTIGYICESKGKKKIILTNHGSPYEAKEKEILQMMDNVCKTLNTLTNVIKTIHT